MTTPTPVNADVEKIVVFDVGARFGIHPSWSALKKLKFTWDLRL